MAGFDLKSWVDKFARFLTPDHKLFEILSFDYRDALILMLTQNPALIMLAKTARVAGSDNLFEKEVAKCAIETLNLVCKKEVEQKYADGETIKNARILFEFTPMLFCTAGEVNKRKDAWIQIVRMLKEKDTEVFWRWVLGAWNETVADSGKWSNTKSKNDYIDLDGILRAVARHQNKNKTAIGDKHTETTLYKSANGKAKIYSSKKLWDSSTHLRLEDILGSLATGGEGDVTPLDIVILAAMEARTQFEMLELCVGEDKLTVKSSYRNRAKQKDLFTWDRSDPDNPVERNLKTESRQAKRMESSSAPGISRHHWGGEFDLLNIGDSGPTGNISFRPQKETEEEKEKKKSDNHAIYCDLINKARYLGFTQPYTDGLFLGFPPKAERDTRVFRGQTNWKRLPADPSGAVQPVDVGNAINAIIMATSAATGGGIAAGNEELYTRRGGYLEECWHWSYYPIGQALSEVISENMVEMHGYLTSYWEKKQTDKCDYKYPISMWPDYVFNVHDIAADFEWRLGGGAISRKLTPEDLKTKFYVITKEGQYKPVP